MESGTRPIPSDCADTYIVTDTNTYIETSKDTDTDIDIDIYIEAPWHRIKGWYKAAVDHAPPLAWVILNRIMAERVDFYSHVSPPGTNIPI